MSRNLWRVVVAVAQKPVFVFPPSPNGRVTGGRGSTGGRGTTGGRKTTPSRGTTSSRPSAPHFPIMHRLCTRAGKRPEQQRRGRPTINNNDRSPTDTDIARAEYESNAFFTVVGFPSRGARFCVCTQVLFGVLPFTYRDAFAVNDIQIRGMAV